MDATTDEAMETDAATRPEDVLLVPAVIGNTAKDGKTTIRWAEAAPMEQDMLVTEAGMDQEEYMMHGQMESIMEVGEMKQETTTSHAQDIYVNDVLVGSRSLESNVKLKFTGKNNFVSCKSDQGGPGGESRCPGGDIKSKILKHYSGGRGQRGKRSIPVTKQKKRKNEYLMLKCNKITDYFDFYVEPAQSAKKRQKMAPEYVDFEMESAQPIGSSTANTGR